MHEALKEIHFMNTKPRRPVRAPAGQEFHCQGRDCHLPSVPLCFGASMKPLLLDSNRPKLVKKCSKFWPKNFKYLWLVLAFVIGATAVGLAEEASYPSLALGSNAPDFK